MEGLRGSSVRAPPEPPALRPEALQASAQGLTLQVLHEHVGGALGELAAVKDLDQTLVGNLAQGQGFVEQALRRARIAAGSQGQHLDCGALAYALVHRLIDHAHAPLPQAAAEPVGTRAYPEQRIRDPRGGISGGVVHGMMSRVTSKFSCGVTSAGAPPPGTVERFMAESMPLSCALAPPPRARSALRLPQR